MKRAKQTIPPKEDDDLIDQLIDQHPGFRDLLEKRLRGRTVSVATATRRLARGERHRAGRP